MSYSNNAIGLHTSRKNWTNPNFNFVVADIGDINNGVNPDFSQIVNDAFLKKLPLVASYKFNCGYYIPYPMKEELLPPPNRDEMLQLVVKALEYKTYAALVIKFVDPRDSAGEVAGDTWISWGGRVFLKRVNEWLNIHKPKTKLLIGYSDDFVKKYSPSMPVWINEYDAYIIQKSSISGAYPQEHEKPRYYSASWKFWEYHNSPELVLFNGNTSNLKNYLNGISTPEQPNKPNQPIESSDLSKKLDVVIKNQETILSEIKNIKDFLYR